MALVAAAFVAGPVSSANGQTARPDFLVGTGDFMDPQVLVYDSGGTALLRLAPGDGGIGATGARVASGDVDGDLAPEIVVGTGPGTASMVFVLGMSHGERMGSFSPYGAFAGGVNVGVGDVDGDTVDEIVTAADAGGGPHVIVWDWSNGVATAKYGWYAYEPGFHGGVNLSVSNLVNSARADIVTAPGAGGGPHVRVWDLGSGLAVEDAGWMAYAPTFTGGVSVGAGEIDGRPTVVTGAGPGGGPHVRVFSPDGAVRSEFFAYAPTYSGGVNVMLGAVQGADAGRVMTVPASWGGPHVRAFTSSGSELFGFMAGFGPEVNGLSIAPVPQTGTSNNVNQDGGSNTSG
jgi:hypothetical protein